VFNAQLGQIDANRQDARASRERQENRVDTGRSSSSSLRATSSGWRRPRPDRAARAPHQAARSAGEGEAMTVEYRCLPAVSPPPNRDSARCCGDPLSRRSRAGETTAAPAPDWPDEDPTGGAPHGAESRRRHRRAPKGGRMSTTEEADREGRRDLMVALGQRPIRGGSVTLHFDGDGLLQEVETKTGAEVRRRAPNHQPPRTSGTT
jgi:hypothetical protein